MRIGLIADTHGLLRPEALASLQGVDVILHAGDIGKPAVLDGLRAIAPVEAIAGNVDRAWCDLPEQRVVEVAGLRVLLVHDWNATDAPPDVDLVVCGHSHKPGVWHEDGLLVVNPGSAGPRRFSLPVSVGVVTIEGSALHAETLPLSVPPPRRRGRK